MDGRMGGWKDEWMEERTNFGDVAFEGWKPGSQ